MVVELNKQRILTIIIRLYSLYHFCLLKGTHSEQKSVKKSYFTILQDMFTLKNYKNDVKLKNSSWPLELRKHIFDFVDFLRFSCYEMLQYSNFFEQTHIFW